MELTILTAADIRTSLPMIEAIELMKQAFVQFSTGHARVPLRTRIDVEKHQGISLFMPSFLIESENLAVKIVSVFPENLRADMATIHAVIVVLDPKTGQVQALLEGASLTAIRTGAASGAATDLLARKNASSVAIFGSGVQARTQLEAICCVRKITKVFVFDVDVSSAATFCQVMRMVPGVPDAIEVAASPIEAVERAEIVCTATTSSKPVFPAEHVSPGTHINAIGSFTPEMQEIESELLQRALIVVDSREAVLAESGDLIIPIQQGMLDEQCIHAELGEIIHRDVVGRTSNDEITIFKSVGLAVQDAIASSSALERALQAQLGVTVNL